MAVEASTPRSSKKSAMQQQREERDACPRWIAPAAASCAGLRRGGGGRGAVGNGQIWARRGQIRLGAAVPGGGRSGGGGVVEAGDGRGLPHGELGRGVGSDVAALAEDLGLGRLRCGSFSGGWTLSRG